MKREETAITLVPHQTYSREDWKPLAEGGLHGFNVAVYVADFLAEGDLKEDF
jgi:hypothetical protein